MTADTPCTSHQETICTIYAFLTEIEPYTISGEIIYTGEDSSNWRHVFDSEAHEWVEQDGYIAYQENGKSIKQCVVYLEDLAKETQKGIPIHSDELER